MKAQDLGLICSLLRRKRKKTFKSKYKTMIIEMIFENVGVEDNGARECTFQIYSFTHPKIKLQYHYHWSPPPTHDGLQCSHDQKFGTIENSTIKVGRPKSK
jgi:hypothetical protein